MKLTKRFVKIRCFKSWSIGHLDTLPEILVISWAQFPLSCYRKSSVGIHLQILCTSQLWKHLSSHFCVAIVHFANSQAQYALWSSNSVAGYSNKTCLETGKWNVSELDYKDCSPNPMLWDRILYHVILLSVSIAVALPALIIFFSYR
jgi:hypothetical protein